MVETIILSLCLLGVLSALGGVVLGVFISEELFFPLGFGLAVVFFMLAVVAGLVGELFLGGIA